MEVLKLEFGFDSFKFNGSTLVHARIGMIHSRHYEYVEWPQLESYLHQCTVKKINIRIWI